MILYPLFRKYICPHFVPVNSQVANRGAVFAVKFIAFHWLHGQVLGTVEKLLLLIRHHGFAKPLIYL